MKKFLAVAAALNSEFLQTNIVVIFYNNKEFFKPNQNDCHFEFKVINPKDASDPIFNQNYQNTYNIKNINCDEKQFEVKINENIKYPHSADSDSESEDYYYEEGLEDNYQNDDKNQNKLQKHKTSK